MRGNVSVLNHFEVSGWIEPNPSPDRAVILADGVEVATVPALGFWQHLKDAGIGDGRCGFQFQFAQPPGVFQTAEIKVLSANTGDTLASGQRTLQPLLFGGAPFRHSLDRRSAALVPTGMVRRENMIAVSARMLAPPGARITMRQLRSDGEFSEIDPGTLSIEAEPVADLPPGSPIFSNVAWHFDARTGCGGDYALFRVCDADTPAAFASHRFEEAVCTACIPLNTDWFTLPGKENAIRTFGSADADMLALASATHGYKIDAIARQLFGERRDLAILDWGMGFGRIAMAVKRLFNPESRIFGFDVDPFNVDWARANLTDVPAGRCDFYPPLPLPTASVDFAYGFSVMTHLTEAAQELWLRELRRVLKPDGACLLTTRSDHLLREQQIHRPDILQQLAAYGLSDSSHDGNLGPKLENKTYYRGTIQLRQQIENTWSRYFEIAAYLPFGFRQDGVILRKA